VKIAQLITRSDTIGGAHVHVRDLTLALTERGHQVRVFVGQQGPFTEFLSASGISFESLRYLRRSIHPGADLRAFFELKRKLLNYSPDLVACHSSKAGWLGRLAARALHIPVVFTAHGWSFTEGVPSRAAFVYRWVERLTASAADRIITVSEYDRRLALAADICSAELLQVVPNGIPDIDPILSADPGVEPVRLVMVARFDQQKDHAGLLQALAGLTELVWSLDLIGDGPRQEECRKLAASLQLTDRIRFLGLRTDVSELLRQAQLGVLVSHWEGLPLTILEAMRAGLPMVASRVGGVSEAISDGETGFLIPRGDVALLRSRLRELIGDAALRRRLGSAGRRRFEAEFSAPRMIEQTLAVYGRALRGKRWAGQF
jgi:glycosyltransferase involved in cell wall biosynthesis